jgi:tripartite-type tricarboxylate transporter receptor subunit TctC
MVMYLRDHHTVPLAAAVVVSVLLGASGACAQSVNVIRIIVPYPPGGGVDVVARVAADAIGNLHGPVMVIENRPGAGSVIGTREVARAKPDSNMLLMTNNALAFAPHMRTLDFDPLVSLSPICSLATTPTVVIVNSASPYRTLDELLAAARARPGTLTFGAGPGAKTDLDVEMISHAANIHMTLIPFGGTAPIVNAILGGQVDTASVDYPAAAGLLQAGKLRALATDSRERLEWMPGVPTLGESGFKDFDIQLWYGVFAPAQMPEPAIARLADWFTQAIALPDTRARLAAQGLSAASVCGMPFASRFRKQYDDYGRIIREANIRAE